MSSTDNETPETYTIPAAQMDAIKAQVEDLDKILVGLRKQVVQLKERNTYLENQVRRLESEVTHVRSIARRHGIV